MIRSTQPWLPGGHGHAHVPLISTSGFFHRRCYHSGIEGEKSMDTKQVVTNYHDTWTRGDMAAARLYLADDLDFQGSIDTFHRADDFIVGLTMFQSMIRGVTLIQSYFSKHGAALLYDCDTMSPAGMVRTAEFFTVNDGKIRSIRLIFDATELRKIMAG